MTNNKQQTAVEWFIEQLRNNENIRWRGTNIIELGEQAKEMDKEQKINAHIDGQSSWKWGETAEQWYNETYGGGNK